MTNVNDEDDVDDGFKSGSDDDLYLADKGWRKLQQRSLTEGYREGLDQASEDSLQTGFDAAYAEAFTFGLELGRIKGKIAGKMVLVQESEERVKRLELLQSEVSLLGSENSDTVTDALAKLSETIDNI